MLFKVDEKTSRRGRAPHELSMLNLMFFNLLLGAGTVVLLLTKADFLQDIGNVGFALGQRAGPGFSFVGYDKRF